MFGFGTRGHFGKGISTQMNSFLENKKKIKKLCQMKNKKNDALRNSRSRKSEMSVWIKTHIS